MDTNFKQSISLHTELMGKGAMLGNLWVIKIRFEDDAGRCDGKNTSDLQTVYWNVLRIAGDHFIRGCDPQDAP